MRERLVEAEGKIVILDDHKFRVAGVAALLSNNSNGLDAEIVSVELADLLSGNVDAGTVGPDTLACIYVVGGLSFHDSIFMKVVEHCRAFLEKRPLIVIIDEIHEKDIPYAMSLGVSGIVPTEMEPDVAVAAIQFILAGGRYFPYAALMSNSSPNLQHADASPSVTSVTRRHTEAEAVSSDPCTAADQCPDVRVDGEKLSLTNRQNDVLMALEKGLTNKEIGRELNLSESTVKVHVRHLMQRFKVTNRTQIALMVSSARHSLQDH